jgi:hypothetical protein
VAAAPGSLALVEKKPHNSRTHGERWSKYPAAAPGSLALVEKKPQQFTDTRRTLVEISVAERRPLVASVLPS